MLFSLLTLCPKPPLSHCDSHRLGARQHKCKTRQRQKSTNIEMMTATPSHPPPIISSSPQSQNNPFNSSTANSSLLTITHSHTVTAAETYTPRTNHPHPYIDKTRATDYFLNTKKQSKRLHHSHTLRLALQGKKNLKAINNPMSCCST